MPEYKTKNCKQRNHPEIAFQLAEEAGIDPQWLLLFFEDAVFKGRQFKAGETVQIGWMVTMLKPNEQGDLEVWEPQFDSFPIKWTQGVNNTLRHLILQKSVTELFGSEPDYPSLRQAGLTTSGFLKASNHWTMSREQASGNDSGWLFSTLNQTRDDGELKSLFEISFYHMEIVPYLALPRGARIEKSDGVIEIQFAAKRITSNENDLLCRLAKSPILV